MDRWNMRWNKNCQVFDRESNWIVNSQSILICLIDMHWSSLTINHVLIIVQVILLSYNETQIPRQRAVPRHCGRLAFLQRILQFVNATAPLRIVC